MKNFGIFLLIVGSVAAGARTKRQMPGFQNSGFQQGCAPVSPFRGNLPPQGLPPQGLPPNVIPPNANFNPDGNGNGINNNFMQYQPPGEFNFQRQLRYFSPNGFFPEFPRQEPPPQPQQPFPFYQDQIENFQQPAVFYTNPIRNNGLQSQPQPPVQVFNGRPLPQMTPTRDQYINRLPPGRFGGNGRLPPTIQISQPADTGVAFSAVRRVYYRPPVYYADVEIQDPNVYYGRG